MIDYIVIDRTVLPFFVRQFVSFLSFRETMPFFVQLDERGA